MKFDLNTAWADTVAMLKSNAETLGIVAAVFFFLPALMVSILAPATQLEQVEDPTKMGEAFMVYLAGAWPVLIVYVLLTIVGTLAVFALFGRRPSPTIGEAISAGIKGFLPYLGSSVILAIAIGMVTLLIGLIAGLTGIAALGFVFGLVFVFIVLVVAIRVLLAGPIIAIEGEMNPLAALKRSWAMVKGNTRRVFFFIVLLMIALIVVSIVLGFLFAGIGAMMGPAAAIWVEGVLGAILGAITTVLLLAAYTAIYRQLAGGTMPSDLQTFE